MNNEKIGLFIKKLRTEKGISQNELGEIVHVTRQAISSWETGKTLPDSDILVSLSDYFNVTINEILSGGEEQRNIQDVALELIDENNKKARRMKRMRNFILISFTSFIILFLGFYFINNYNSIKVYRTIGESEHFRIRDGVIISTSKSTYFKFGNLESKIKDNNNVSKVKLYYMNNKKEVMIFESDMLDRLFTEKDGYKELHKNNFEKYKDKIYLEITYNENEKETMKIDVKEDFKNNYVMTVSTSNALRSELTNQIKSELQAAYIKESIEYEKKYQERQDEGKEKTKEEVVVVHQVVSHQISYDPQPVQEEKKEEPQPVEEEPPVVEEPVIEEPVIEEPKPIDYDEIVSIIEAHGTKMGRMYSLEYILEDRTNICISSYKKVISIESRNGNIIEAWTNVGKPDGKARYQRYDNNIMTEDLLIDEIDNKELIEKMNNNILLVYQEIE